MGAQIGDLVRGTCIYSSDSEYEGVIFEFSHPNEYTPYVKLKLLEEQDNCYPGSTVFVRADSIQPVKMSTPRQDILDEAGKLIHSDRNSSYGEPTQNFTDTAALWNVQFAHKLKEPLTSTDVALAMVLLKMARIKAKPKRDNWADIIGYSACGFECDIAEKRIEE